MNSGLRWSQFMWTTKCQQILTGTARHIWIHQEIIHNKRHVATKLIHRNHGQTWHHQYEPKYLSAITVRKMTKVFKNDIDLLTRFSTPDTVHYGIVYNKKTWYTLPKYLHIQYCSVVGFLLYLVNHPQL